MMRCRILKDNVLDIVIKDKGIGIADTEQARRPMYTTGGSDRSGMGFTIMESFMTSFELDSQPGKGTTVHMRRRIGKRQ
jgi:stage II sporulation protein AB (anti-sigma F factor)